MDERWGVGVPDSAIVALAQLMLKRSKLRGMKVSTRQNAIGLIKGLRPAISKATPLTSVVQSAIGKKAKEIDSVCTSCGKPLPFGSLCRTLWKTYEGEHIQCTGTARRTNAGW